MIDQARAKDIFSDVQTPRNCYICTRVFNMISKHWKSNISNTRKSDSSDIQTPRSNISNTRKSDSSDIQTPRGTQTQERVFHLISKHWESNISNTRKSVSSDIHTPTSNISNTRKSVSSDIQTPRSNISNRTEWFVWYPNTGSDWQTQGRVILVDTSNTRKKLIT